FLHNQEKLVTSIGDTPQYISAIIVHKERTIGKILNCRWSSVNFRLSLIGNKTRHKIFGFTTRFSIFKRNKHYLITGERRLIPRTVLGNKNTVSVFFREFRSHIKRQS